MSFFRDHPDICVQITLKMPVTSEERDNNVAGINKIEAITSQQPLHQPCPLLFDTAFPLYTKFMN